MTVPIEITGVDIVGSLLRDHTPLTTMVTASNIKGGRLPDGVALPALLIRVVSSIERQPLKRGAIVTKADRISVTVRAKSYDQQVKIIGIVRRCCAGRTGTISGAANVSILSAGTGPDMAGPADSYEQAQDFRVSYDAPA